MTTLLKRGVYGALLLIVLASPNLVIGCGPEFPDAVFTFTYHPDVPLEPYVAGRLGVVQPSYRPSYLVIAYRNLSGLKFDARESHAVVAALEQRMWKPLPPRTERPEALDIWKSARAKIVQDKPEIEKYGHGGDYNFFPNCGSDSFANAARVLDERIAKYGANSRDVREWVNGQDAVFGNCSRQSKLMPALLGPDSAAWLRADRVYQIAAAHFYAGRFEEALAAFREIAEDKLSPWSGLAPYLAARCMIRKALEQVSDENTTADMKMLAEAEAALRAIVADAAQRRYHQTARGLLGFVEYRLHPQERMHELAATLAQAHPGTSAGQDIVDYMLLLDKSTEAADEMTDWIRTVQSGAPPISLDESGKRQGAQHPKEQVEHALSRWRASRSTKWLVAAMILLPAGSAAQTDLIAAARELEPGDPGFLTVRYQAARLLIDSGQTGEARALLESVPLGDAPPSARNLFLQQRARAAANFETFLASAGMVPASEGGDQSTWPGDYANDAPKDPRFDVYAANILNKRTPLSQLLVATHGEILPANLRRELALAAWTRAALLDGREAAELSGEASRYEPAAAFAMQQYRDAPPPDKHFAAVWIILHNPALRPFVQAGTSHRESKISDLDSFRDNWWCSDVGADPSEDSGSKYEYCLVAGMRCAPGEQKNETFTDPAVSFPFPSYASAGERTAAEREWKKLTAIGTAPNYLGEQTLAWAKAHPDDPRLPEALAMVVRATRFGCVNKQTTAASKAAFTLLHQRYPQSEWTKRTRYWY